MDISGLSAAYPGFVQGEMNLAQLAQQRAYAKNLQLHNQEELDDRAALAALGNAFGVAPPNAPAPMGPGQPSQPPPPPPGPPPPAPPPSSAPGIVPAATSTGAPIAPPGSYLNPPQAQPSAAAAPPPRPTPSMVASNGPTAGAPPRPAAPAQSAPSPRPAAAPPSPRPAGPPPLPNSMSMQQLQQRILAANPGLRSRPDILVRAMMQGEKLLNPDGKLQLQAELQVMKIQQQAQAAVQRAQTAEQVAKIKAAAAEQVAQVRGAQAAQSRAGVNRRQLVGQATKLGVKVDPSWTDDELQAKVAEAAAAQQKEGILDDNALTNLAKEAHGGINVSPQLGRGKERTQNVQALQKKLTEMYGKNVADDIVKKQIEFAGAKSAATAAGGQAGRLASAVNELKPWGALVKQLSKEVDRGRFTTLNSWMLWAKQHASDPKVAKYMQAVVGLKSIYAQIMARGRKPNVQQYEEADSIINKAYSDGTLDQLIDQIGQEGEIARDAATQSVKDAGDITSGAPPAAGAVALPDRARSQLKEGKITTFGNGQKWTLQNGQPKQVQ